MLRLPEDGRRAVYLRPGVDEISWVELVAAVVALVSARRVKAADRARALDVPIGKGVSRRGGERPECLALEHEAPLVQRSKQILRDAIVIPRGRPREEVVGEPEREKVLPNERVEAVRRLTRRLAGRVGRHHDGRAVLVGTAHHEDVVPSQSVIARKRVRWDAEACDMADVTEAARIRPCDCDQDLPRLRRSAHGRQ